MPVEPVDQDNLSSPGPELLPATTRIPAQEAAASSPISATVGMVPSAPEGLPPAFWDEAAGTMRVAELVEGYRALEERLQQALPRPAGPDDDAARTALFEALGRPASAADYAVATTHPLLAADVAVNERLHAAGFTQAQAQLVYDLAAEVLVPITEEVQGQLHLERQQERLAAEFGGREAWRRTAQDLKIWGRTYLDPETFATLGASADGVLAMYQMMRSREPALVGHGEGSVGSLNEASLHEMVRDPRYWRDRDPEFVSRVTAGFARVYGN